jgi:hypothetical protein
MRPQLLIPILEHEDEYLGLSSIGTFSDPDVLILSTAINKQGDFSIAINRRGDFSTSINKRIDFLTSINTQADLSLAINRQSDFTVER